MGGRVKTKQPQTVGDVLDLAGMEVAIRSYNNKSLDELSSEDFGVLIGAVIDFRAEVEAIEDKLNDEWAKRYVVQPDGQILRREA